MSELRDLYQERPVAGASGPAFEFDGRAGLSHAQVVDIDHDIIKTQDLHDFEYLRIHHNFLTTITGAARHNGNRGFTDCHRCLLWLF